MMLVDAIYEEAQRRAQEKLEDARREAEAILARARSEAEALRNEKLRVAEEKARSERRRIVSSTELDNQRENLIFKEKLIMQVFDIARRRLGDITGREEYPDLLRRLVVEAISTLADQDLTVMVREEDIPLVGEGFLQEIAGEVARSRSGRPGVSLHVERCDRPISGGCIVRTSDGHSVFDNSLERRLERQIHSIRFKVAQVLFDGDKGAGQDGPVRREVEGQDG
ncbi:MAG TPA: hypothetical protein GXX51_02785 [Firmicutes bacterium]|nr:hypothetical protein [Bacillota bacterium]